VNQSAQIGAVLQRWISAFCLLLVLAVASLEAVHVHPGGAASRGSESSCLICMSVHANPPALTTHFLPVLSAVGVIVVVREIAAKGITSHLELFIRPPPSA
jgi:hypothetical protein